MPSMYEIYAAHGDVYDALVDAEDADGHLRRRVRALVPPGGRVLEAGCGTGRVTAMYADLAGSVLAVDRSAHMLARARQRVADAHVRWDVVDHDALGALAPEGPFDVLIEGWAFGHLVSDHPGREDEICDHLVRICETLAPTLVFIETRGTLTDGPCAPAPFLDRFYARLEGRHGFVREDIPTDYVFPDAATARARCGAFFGDELAARIAAPRVPEWTGVWVRRA